ncbi:aspartate aminotransferase family protein [Aminipila terrae]|uniref:glutamate-1-semialdehyde 2,1-aminomutase n=1 Tax=Aminipila terrae TaxID=2697030 RepID=A0A6P1MGD5_9FIRM|nr:aspartate aminotransferase family protein [Aminipila terrae]QHI73750.1 aminotransferase class III-fold pyridoxal phosphate-dependent enzyme [Aminipila terrae]
MSIEQQFTEETFNRYRESRKISLKLHKEACKYMPGGDTRTATYFEPYPHYIVKGDGAYIYDADGNKLVDFQNNYTSLIHGHNHKPTVEALQEQAALGTAYTAPFEKQTRLAEILINRVPSIDLIRFTNSGTEANMHVLRIARAYTQKSKIIKTEGGYHGTTDVFEASVDPNIKKAGTLDNIKVIPESRGVSRNALKDVLVVPFNDIENTKKVIENNFNDVACLIIEPVMGSAGQIVPTREYLEFLREITKHYGILLIFDEVVTFRLSMGGAQEKYGITPDLTSLGKIIGGGTPIGAFGGKEEIMKMYDPREKKMYHSGTFNGNALGMAGGIATLTAYNQDMVNKVNDLGTKFKTELENVFVELGLDLQVSGTGSLYNIIFSNKSIRNYRDVAGSYEKLNSLLFMSLLLKGVFNAPRGMFCMSTAMSQKDIDFAIEKLRESLLELKPVIRETAPELVK